MIPQQENAGSQRGLAGFVMVAKKAKMIFVSED